MEELTVRQAEAMLEEWGKTRGALDLEREIVVRTAYASGIGKSRIAQLTGMSRDTVNRILREPRPDPYPDELGELYCDEDETLCVPGERPCMCCRVTQTEEDETP